MWLTGFDKLMPEGRAFPWKYIPTIGARLTVTIGDPISPNRIRDALDIDSLSTTHDISPHTDEAERLTGWIGSEASERLQESGLRSQNPRYARIIRERITTLIQHEVEALGRSVSGPLLSEPIKTPL